MYSNLGTKKIKKEVRAQTKDKEKLNTTIFIPDTNIIDNQTEKINKVCPRSGWDKRRITVGIKIQTLNKYLKYKFFLSIDNINEVKRIKKGFNVSIGWNLGNDPKLNHLFDPFTSIPIIGTSTNAIKAKKNNIMDSLIINSWFNIENTKIIEIPINTNTRCFKKK